MRGACSLTPLLHSWRPLDQHVNAGYHVIYCMDELEVQGDPLVARSPASNLAMGDRSCVKHHTTLYHMKDFLYKHLRYQRTEDWKLSLNSRIYIT